MLEARAVGSFAERAVGSLSRDGSTVGCGEVVHSIIPENMGVLPLCAAKFSDVGRLLKSGAGARKCGCFFAEGEI